MEPPEISARFTPSATGGASGRGGDVRMHALAPNGVDGCTVVAVEETYRGGNAGRVDGGISLIANEKT